MISVDGELDLNKVAMAFGKLTRGIECYLVSASNAFSFCSDFSRGVMGRISA